MRLWSEGGTLRYSAPPGALTAELREELRARKGEILAALDTARREAGGGLPLTAVARDAPLPPSFAQERLWFLHEMGAAGAGYTVPLHLRWTGPLDRAALARSVRDLVERHEALRTAVRAEGGRPVQVIEPAGSGPALPVVDLAALDPAAQAAEVRRLARAESRRAFALARPPLVRARLLALSPTEHVLLQTFHHAACDAWSLGIYAGELAALYDAYAAGRPSALPPLPLQYADFAAWQRGRMRGPALDDGIAYWTRQLAGLPPVELPADSPRAASPSRTAAGVSVRIPSEVTGALRAIGQQAGATLFMTLLAAFQALLSRHTGARRVAVGCPVANRSRPEMAGVMGLFSNTLVLCADLEDDPDFMALLARVREVVLGGYAHEDVPFEKVVEALQPERDLGRNPLFQVSFALQSPSAMLPRPRAAGVALSLLPDAEATVRFDVEVHAWEDGDEVAATFLYRADLFRPERMEAFARHFQTLLAAVAAAPRRPLSTLSLMGVAERAAAVARGGARAAYDGRCLHEVFAAQAVLTPDAVAVVGDADERLTYGELDARSNRLARHLRALGVGPEARIALCVQRSAAMVTAILGILKAGGAYVPLDPAHPAERLAWLLADSRPSVLLTERALREAFAGYSGAVVDIDDPALDGGAAEAPASGARPDNVAYVIYTSGSTGEPKGVAVSHGSATRLFDATREQLGFHAGMTWSLFHSVAFDFSVWELWGALLHGGCVVVVPYWVSRSPQEFHALLAREQVTVLSQTPSAFRQLMVEAAADRLPLTHVVFGGEALAFDSLAPWVAAYGDAQPALVNMYGITETTVHVTYRRVDRQDVTRGGSLIGAPLRDLDLYLLDARQDVVPDGVVAELYVGGGGVARGYLGRPGLTAARFVPHPFRAGARLYRSGDLARARGDDVEYLGRADAQVQLRGFRVEPGEIEAALRTHPMVRDAVVEYRDDGARGGRLLACVVKRPGEAGGAPERQALRRHLADRLPEHMIPAAIAIVDALPLTANGKLDRAALAALAEPDPGTAAAEAPRSADEEVMAGLWARRLDVARVGRHDSFFDLGGHSLLAMQLVADLRDVFGVDVPVRRVFESPTVAALARVVAAARAASLQEGPPPAPRPPGARPVLSFAQARLWLIHRLEPDSAAYNLPAAYRLTGALDVPALERSLREIARRHEALRTCVREIDGAPVPVAGDADALTLPVVDLSEAGGDEREQALLRVQSEEAARPFRLEREWPWRVRLVRLDATDHVLLITLHHIAADGWSLAIVVDELRALYETASAEVPAPPPLQYADYAAWQQERLQGEPLAASLAYWKGQLAAAPALPLPLDRPRPAVRRYEGAAHAFSLSREVTGALADLGRREHVTPFMTLLAAFGALLSRWAGATDVVIGAPVANRGRAEIERVIGIFVNTLVLRIDLSGDPSFPELLTRVRRVALDAFAHAELPFEKIVEEVQPARDLSRNPLFQVSFTMQPPESAQAPWRLGQVHATPMAPARLAVRFDLELHAWEDDGCLVGAFLYDTALFLPVTIERLAGSWQRLVEAIASGASARTGSLPLLSSEETAAALARGTRRASFAGGCLHELFAAQAAQRPGAVAVVAPADGAHARAALTYGELDERSSRLAHHLRALGVNRGDRVAMFVERSAAMVTAILGILKSGAAYVPLDPATPAERLAYLLADARPRAVVTDAGLRARLPAPGVPIVCLDGDAGAIGERPRTDPGTGVTPSDVAYVIYTSGSTGEPKGVAVSHHGVTRLFAATREWFDFDATMVWSLFHSVAFDFSVWELWGALLHGGRVIVVPYWVSRSPLDFHALLASEGVTMLSQTPSAFRSLIGAALQAAAGDGLCLRHVVFGGEALDFRMLAPWIERHGDRAPRLVNMYGITETTVHVSYRPITRADVAEPRSLIGAPLPDLDLYILDEHLLPVPDGVAGELYVGGAGLACGYHDREALTRERFVPHPFRPGERLYRTGDRARVVAPDDIEYLGRLDAQVQLRGFRVEPGEIEATLRAHAGVQDAVVLHRADGPRGARLVAYAVARAGGVDGPALRRYLADKLPEHMVPASVVVLEALPLTANGKLDTAALLACDDGAAEPPVESAREPDEELIAGMWTALLGAAPAGLHASFFDAGGHSLLAAQLVSKIRDVFGVDLPLREVFERPTVHGLAHAVRAARVRPENLPPLTRALPAADYPLTFAQERLWFLDRLEGGAPTFNVGIALRLQGALDVEALARSLTDLAARHDALRTRIVVRDDVPRQRVEPPAPFALARIDLGALDGEAAARAERQCMRQEAALAFDLQRQPPLRATLLVRGPGHHVLLLSAHHIAIDGWSIRILLDEWAALYAARAAGTAADLPALPIQYADFATWQRRAGADDRLAASLRYWRGRLADAPPPLPLPVDRPRPAVPASRGRTHAFTVTPELTRALKTLSARAGTTLFMTLCAAYATLLSRYTGATDLCVGTPVANRTRAEIEPLIGCFVDTIVLRLDLSGDPRFSDLLVRVRRQALEAYEHQDVPFDRVVEAAQPERRLSHTPLFQTMFDLQPAGVTAMEIPGLRVSALAHGHATSKFDVSLSMSEAGGGLQGFWEYRTDLFEDATFERWTSHLASLLASIVAEPEAALGSLPLMTAAEERRLLQAAVNPDPALDAAVPVHRMIEARAARTPDAVAVAGAAGATLTYAALNERANRLAHLLRRYHGVGPDTVVGVLLDRSPELIASLLAVLKAGGAYLPLDPAYPDERLGAMVSAAGAVVVITEARLAGRLEPLKVDALVLEAAAAALAAQPEGDPAGAVPADSLAYVIFTSGSTGVPKGVMIPHGALAGFTAAALARYDIGRGDRVLQLASPSFDTAGEEIYPCLAAGGALVLATEGMTRSIPELLQAADERALTVLDLPTAYWHHVVAELAASRVTLPAAVRLVIIGGERAHPERLAQWHATAGRLPRLLNTYGPTETTVVATAGELGGADAGLVEVPLGRPLANVETYVLDRRRAPAGWGVPGEVHIGGRGLARGYAGQPGATAARFVPHPFGAPGARLYRSGDLARWLDGGTLQFAGRADAQVKIRGYRVEPGEVEAVLAQEIGVREAAVVARHDGSGDVRLVAYVVAEEAGAPADMLSVRLREALRRRLPEPMIPAAVVVLGALPRTPGGKVDRRALPAPDRAAAAGATAYAAPATSHERMLAALWAEVLGLDAVGADDNFFDLGGHSLLLLALQRRLSERLAREIRVVDLFRFPTVRTLAAHLATGAGDDASAAPGATQRRAALQQDALRRFQRRGRGGEPAS